MRSFTCAHTPKAQLTRNRNQLSVDSHIQIITNLQKEKMNNCSYSYQVLIIKVFKILCVCVLCFNSLPRNEGQRVFYCRLVAFGLDKTSSDQPFINQPKKKKQSQDQSMCSWYHISKTRQQQVQRTKSE